MACIIENMGALWALFFKFERAFCGYALFALFNARFCGYGVTDGLQ